MNKHEWKASKATGERVERYTRKSLLSRKYIKIKFTALLRKQKRKKKEEKRFKFLKTIRLKIMKIISIVLLRGKCDI